MKINNYRIADLPCRISFTDGQPNSELFIPSFEPFRTEGFADDEELLFSLSVDDKLRRFREDECERIKDVEGGNGNITVDQTRDGYQFIIKNIYGNSCCLLQSNADFTNCHCALRGNIGMRIYGLNNALMIVFAFAGCRKNTLLVHASTVRRDGWGYAFTAKSGTGKSTHVAQWMACLDGCDIINDDNPVLRVVDGRSYLFGSPWSGKTPCYRNVRVPLGAIVKVNRADENDVKPATTLEAFITMLSACATMKWDCSLFDNICDSIKAIIETTPNFNLFCRPDNEAAKICYKVIKRSAS